MLEELEKLIKFIQTEYIQFNKKWQNSDYYTKINLKDNLVIDLSENEEILNWAIERLGIEITNIDIKINNSCY